MDALDGVEEVPEGVEITMLLSDLVGCRVPVLKFSFMGLKPLEPARIQSIVDDLFLPLAGLR